MIGTDNIQASKISVVWMDGEQETFGEGVDTSITIVSEETAYLFYGKMMEIIPMDQVRKISVSPETDDDEDGVSE